MKADDRFFTFYRAKTDEQTWQKYLLQLYGSELIIIDATYKTTQYSLPLFFLTVKTNLNYQLVDIFVTENETFQSVTEVLAIIKQVMKS